MMEDLMLMETGKLAYFGTTKNARCFFDTLAGQCPHDVNPAGELRLVAFGCEVRVPFWRGRRERQKNSK